MSKTPNPLDFWQPLSFHPLEPQHVELQDLKWENYSRCLKVKCQHRAIYSREGAASLFHCFPSVLLCLRGESSQTQQGVELVAFADRQWLPRRIHWGLMRLPVQVGSRWMWAASLVDTPCCKDSFHNKRGPAPFWAKYLAVFHSVAWITDRGLNGLHEADNSSSFLKQSQKIRKNNIISWELMWEDSKKGWAESLHGQRWRNKRERVPLEEITHAITGSYL